jgi:hypothetical protein
MTAINVQVNTGSPIYVDVTQPRASIKMVHSPVTVEIQGGGQPGPPGPKGDRGPAGSDVAFTHTQITPAATWTITNPLGRYPTSVNVIINGEMVETDVELPSISQIVVTFAQPQSGLAEIA